MLIGYSSDNRDIYYYIGKLPEQHFSVWLFSNPEDKILFFLKFNEARISEWNIGTFVINQFIGSLFQQVIFLFRIFNIQSIPNCKSQGAEILSDCSPCTICHMSHVKSHVSQSHVSGVTIFFTKWLSQSVQSLLSMGPTLFSLFKTQLRNLYMYFENHCLFFVSAFKESIDKNSFGIIPS